MIMNVLVVLLISCLVQITSIIHTVNSIQLQKDCLGSLSEFTSAWLCKDLTFVHLKGHCVSELINMSLKSYMDFEEKKNIVFVNQRVLQQVGMCKSAIVYMQTAFIYVF